MTAVVLICLPGTRATAAAAEPTLEQVRAATEKYRDVKVALADGYVADPSGMCMTADMIGRDAAEGGMGVHYFRPDLLGIKGPPQPPIGGDGVHTDFGKPAVLLYEPQADGSVRLVGVENLVFAQAWRAAGHKQPPSFAGEPYDHMVDDPETALDEAHAMAEHYDRHVWVHRPNPRGVFAQFNPDVTCKHAKTPAPAPAAGHAGHAGH